MCEHRYLDRADGLACTRLDPHDTGHVYVSSSGSDVDDRHADGGHG